MRYSLLILALLLASLAATTAPATKPATAPSTAPATQRQKPTLAVLPFLSGTDAKEKALAEKMRFAVSQKLSTDTNASAAGGAFQRLDNVMVEGVISALQITWSAEHPPDDNDMQQVLAALNTQWTISGKITGRKLTLSLYQNATYVKSSTVDIPPDNTSPKLAVEQILTDLTGTAFAHIREVEADHSNPAVEARFAKAPNLVPDPGFEAAATDPTKTGTQWQVLLHADHYAPPLLTADQAKTLEPDRVAIVPKSAAGVAGGNQDGYCLMMRMGKEVAESNGLACESIWVPVEQGKKYRFSVQYHSTGATARLFLKGFAFKPDQFGDKNDLEAVRREYYRAQILPRSANRGWDTIDMDFTPGSLKPTDPKIEWIRVDLYIYLTPGDCFFDDVVIKKIDE